MGNYLFNICNNCYSMGILGHIDQAVVFVAPRGPRAKTLEGHNNNNNNNNNTNNNNNNNNG